MIKTIGMIGTGNMGSAILRGVVEAEYIKASMIVAYDTSSRRLREAYRRYWLSRQTQLQETFAKCNVDNVSIATDEDYVKLLLGLFKQRA